MVKSMVKTMVSFKFRIARDKNASCIFKLFICKFSIEQNSESTYSLRNRLTFANLAYICGNHLQLWNPKQLAIFACCGIRDTTNMPTKFTLHSYVRGIHLHFGTCLKFSFWNPGTYRHKIFRLSSAQFGLVMMSPFF